MPWKFKAKSKIIQKIRNFNTPKQTFRVFGIQNLFSTHSADALFVGTALAIMRTRLVYRTFTNSASRELILSRWIKSCLFWGLCFLLYRFCCYCFLFLLCLDCLWCCFSNFSHWMVSLLFQPTYLGVFFIAEVTFILGFLCGTSGKDSTCHCRRHERCEFDPWVGKIPWRRVWQPTPVLLPGKFHGQRSLVGYSLWGHKELDVTEWLSPHACNFILIQF